MQCVATFYFILSLFHFLYQGIARKGASPKKCFIGCVNFPTDFGWFSHTDDLGTFAFGPRYLHPIMSAERARAIKHDAILGDLVRGRRHENVINHKM